MHVTCIMQHFYRSTTMARLEASAPALGAIDLWRKLLHIPDLLGVFVYTATAATCQHPVRKANSYSYLLGSEESHPADSSDTLGQPFVLVSVRLIDELMGLDVAVKVVGNQVVIAMVDNAIDESAKLSGLAELATLDSVKHLDEVWIEFELGVVVCMPKVFNIFSKVSKEENVLFPNFACNFYVRSIASQN